MMEISINSMSGYPGWMFQTNGIEVEEEEELANPWEEEEEPRDSDELFKSMSSCFSIFILVQNLSEP